MNRKCTYLFLALVIAGFCSSLKAQLYPVNITEKAANATLVVEGKVVAQQCFWNAAHTLIYTANTIELYKSFKGQATSNTIEVLTQGGTVGNEVVEVSDLAQLTVGEKGMFFLYPNTINLRSPASGRLLYDIYASDQGVMRYSINQNKAFCPFEEYDGIATGLYSRVQALAGRPYSTLNAQYNVNTEVANSRFASRQSAGTISSTSPTVVNPGAILDPLNNVLTITGNNFGTVASGDTLLFTDGNTNLTYPSFKVASTSPNIISWTDTEIRVKVPGRAANGRFAILYDIGDTTYAPQPLKVNYAIIDATFGAPYGLQEPRLTSRNGAGGYNIVYSTSTAGSGVDITTSPIYNTFRRALITWKEISGVNFAEAGNTTTQTVNAGDGENIILLDNTNTGQAVLPAGTLAVTYSSFTICTSPVNAVAQKRGFDVLIRNQGVSTGTVGFENGPCPPPFVNPGTTDLETVILHELGHALNLAHVNEPAQITGTPFNFANFVNPSSLMHYAVSNYATRHTPDAPAYEGSLYTITPRGVTLGTCISNGEMTPLTTSVPANDNCPLSFPTSTTLIGSVYNIDLVHATSNKAVDPQFTAAYCTQPISVTNNVYQAIRTGGSGNLAITVSGYTTVPELVATTCGVNQGVRVSIYDVATCPTGQAFPAPTACLTIAGNGVTTGFTGLGANKTYLLYFEGVRNTKATFSVTLAGTALPLKLVAFTGKNINGTTNLLSATIAEAVNVKSVIVERSADGVNFKSVGQLTKTGSTFNGQHRFTDAAALKGINYYRLKSNDVDGKFEYSNIVALTTAGQVDISFLPNPFSGFINIKTQQVTAKLHVIVTDAVARKVAQATFNGSTQIKTSLLAKGTYLVSIYDANGQLLATKKMIKN